MDSVFVPGLLAPPEPHACTFAHGRTRMHTHSRTLTHSHTCASKHTHARSSIGVRKQAHARTQQHTGAHGHARRKSQRPTRGCRGAVVHQLPVHDANHLAATSGALPAPKPLLVWEHYYYCVPFTQETTYSGLEGLAREVVHGEGGRSAAEALLSRARVCAVPRQPALH